MSYYNEATAEIIEVSEDRHNKIDIQKVISGRDICQHGYSSSDKLTIMSDNLEKYKEVKLNYIGSKLSLKNYGKHINDNVLSLPCLTRVDTNGLVVPKSGNIVAETTEIYDRDATVEFELEENYTIASQTISVSGKGKFNIFKYTNGREVFVENGTLYGMYAWKRKIADLPKNKRILISAVIAKSFRGIPYGYPISAMYFILMIDNKIVYYNSRYDYPDVKAKVKRASLRKGLGYKQIPQRYGNKTQKFY
jgi:hypothetical protein